MVSARRFRWWGSGLLALALSWSTSASAGPPSQDEEPDPETLRIYKRISEPRGGYAKILSSAAFGRGFRVNNPYRLATQLGDTAESVSLTAPFWDLGFGVTVGDPYGLQHGGVAHLSVALAGVGQQAVSASYLLLWRSQTPFMAYGRIGPSFLLSPDPNVGGELAAGGAYFITGGLGVNLELIGNLFYGAGTYEAQYTVIPVLSFQAGIIMDYEVLP